MSHNGTSWQSASWNVELELLEASSVEKKFEQKKKKTF